PQFIRRIPYTTLYRSASAMAVCRESVSCAMAYSPAMVACTGGRHPAGAKASGPQGRRMVGDMITDEAGNEVVAMVIPRLAAQRQRMARRFAGGFQQIRAQLAVQELV